MFLDFLMDRFREAPDADALIWRDQAYAYGWLRDEVERRTGELEAAGVSPGSVVSLEADFSPAAVAMLVALVGRGAVCVPMTSSVAMRADEFRTIAEVEIRVAVGQDDEVRVESTGRTAQHTILRGLKERRHPGLVLFSSGSTGASKAAVHDFVPLLAKFEVPRKSMRFLTFLLFDHIGGVNTLFHALSNAGCVVTVRDRTPDAVLSAIQAHRVEVLPTTPTFLNLLLLSEACPRYDLSSLKLVTYGAEPMPASTLRRMRALLPDARFLQTYGLTEVGILRSQSRSSDSLWVKVGGEGFETRVVDGLLEIRAQSAMLGYLNAPSPFTEDGWLQTGDAVEVDGEYLRILGRSSEIINVGGEKVYPAEVESVVLQLEGVEEAVVVAEPSPITGQLVKAKVKLSEPESVRDFQRRLRIFCRDKLQRFQIPQKVQILDAAMHGERFKTMRRETETETETERQCPAPHKMVEIAPNGGP